MNGDYEEALLRMLSGEGDCLLLDSAAARQEMQKELASPNPNTGLFREFAAVDVRLHPRRVPLGAGPGPEVRAAEVSAADTIDPEVAPTRAAEVELEAEGELKAAEEIPLKAAEVGGGGPDDPAATLDGAEPVELLRAEPGSSGEDGVVGHIETASAPPPAFEQPAPDGTASGGRRTQLDGVPLVPRGPSGARTGPFLSVLWQRPSPISVSRVWRGDGGPVALLCLVWG